MADKCRECGSDWWAFNLISGKGYCVPCKDRGYDERRLRDEFALGALRELIGLGTVPQVAGVDLAFGEIPGYRARRAYAYADAMIAARKTEGGR